MMTSETKTDECNFKSSKCQSIELTWTFLNYWHAGTGEGSYHADATIDLDDHGLPKLDGKHCKGLLSEAAKLLAATEYPGWNDNDAVGKLFGKEGAATSAGLISFSTARLPQSDGAAAKPYKQLLTSILRSTALDEKTQSAKDGSLRNKQVAIPMSLVQVLSVSENNLTKLSKAKIDWVECMRQAASLVRSAGSNRERGLGKVSITVKEVSEVPVATQDNLDSGETQNNLEAPASSKAIWYEFKLTLEAQSRLVLSTQGATQGAHRTSSVIEGARLMGWVANDLFGTTESNAADAANSGFQNTVQGGISFGDARPVINGLVTEPLAVSLRSIGSKSPKKGWSTENQKTEAAEIFDTSAQEYKGESRLYGAPQALVDGTGLAKPRTRYRLRTATQNGTAAEGQLFGFDALCEGQTFESTCLVPASAIAILQKKFAENAVLSLGRSKNVEYGKVKVLKAVATAVVTENNSIAESICAASKSSEGLRILCLSHMQVFDNMGMPTVAPLCSEWLGLPAGGKLVLERSTVEPIMSGSYNGYYGRQESERLLIGRGSVLCFDFSAAPIWTDGHTLRWLRGLGHGQERGYGEVRLWCGTTEVCKSQYKSDEGASNLKDSKTNSSLLTWLKAKESAVDSEKRRHGEAQAIIRQVDAWLLQAAKLQGRASWQGGNGEQAVVSLCPAKSQWNAIGECKTFAALSALLMPAVNNSQTQQGTTRASSPWSLPIGQSNQNITLGSALLERLSLGGQGKHDINQPLCEVLGKLASKHFGGKQSEQTRQTNDSTRTNTEAQDAG